MKKDKLEIILEDIADNNHLVDRFEQDVIEVYKQMKFLEIVFDNLQGTMMAIWHAHKVIKDTTKE